MNCHTHADRTAMAVCVNCGAALCASCSRKTEAHKNVCSEQCAAASTASDNALSMVSVRMRRSGRASAWFCWSLGAIFGVLGLFSLRSDLFFAIYLLAPCVVFVSVGFWYNNIANRPSNNMFERDKPQPGRPSP